MSENKKEQRVFVPPLNALPEINPLAQNYVFEGAAFATSWKAVVSAAPALSERAHADLKQRFQDCLDQIDREMSPYRKDSDLTRFNNAKPWQFVPLPPMIMEVIYHAIEIAELTGGTFDPCLLDAVEAWGFGSKAVLGGLADVAELSGGGWRDLIWQEEGLIRPETGRLDLCAIAKGYASDKLLDIIKAETHCVAALVEVGGELKSWGVQADGRPWWIEIEGVNAIAALHDMAVATSGDGVRFFIHEGEILSHTIDSATCTPVRSGIASVTVFDRHGWRADALATALMVMGEARAMAFATRHMIACIMRIREGDGFKERRSPIMETWL